MSHSGNNGLGLDPHAHLRSYFDPDREHHTSFAWAAKCGFQLHRRRRLFALRSSLRGLALWTDEDGRLRVTEAFQQWRRWTELHSKFEKVAAPLARRYLRVAMHRWFDYLPICQAARTCDRVFTAARVGWWFFHWKVGGCVRPICVGGLMGRWVDGSIGGWTTFCFFSLVLCVCVCVCVLWPFFELCVLLAWPFGGGPSLYRYRRRVFVQPLVVALCWHLTLYWH